MSLNTRVLVAMMGIPLIVYAIMACLFVIHNDSKAYRLLTQRLQNSSEVIALPLAQALKATDADAIEQLTQRWFEQMGLRSLTLHDSDGNRLISLGRSPLDGRTTPPEQAFQLDDQPQVWRLATTLPALDSSRSPGWIEAELDTHLLRLEHYRWIAIFSLGGMLLGLTLFLVAFAISRFVTRPLEEANRALYRLSRGDYRFSLSPAKTQEHRQLADNINTLADTMQLAQHEMQVQIEQATSELQESMETIEEQNIKLDMAHRSAVRANAVKSEFLANMSHEIRTPLNGIIGFCRLLGRSKLEERQQEWLQHVHRACDNLLMLVNDVLDFSKLEANQLTLENANVDMVRLVDEVVGLHAPEAQRKQLHLIGMVYDDVPTPLQGDPLRIHQVLNNLVGNAVKFTRQGEVIIRVMLDEPAESFNEAHLTVLRINVSDTGIGLSEEQQQQVFGIFSQAEPSHSREFGGSGLGLSICRQLIQRMDGDISVESTLGQGTTFSFTLTMRSNNAQPRPRELMLSQPAICLQESHPPTRFMFEHLIQRWGGKVMPLTSLAECQLLIIGVSFEECHSSYCEKLQAIIQSAPCPSLVLANSQDIEATAFHMPRGGQLLCKPVGRDALAAAIRQQLISHSIVPTSAQPVITADDEQSQQRHVLVVDDNTSNRELLQAMLQQDAIQVNAADSGHVALALAREASQPFDMILMDIRMPDMDGIQTMQAIRRLGGLWASCPIVAVTAHALHQERQQWLNEGMDDVLIKPVNEQQLEQLMQRFLGIGLPIEATRHQPRHQRSTLPIVDLELGAKLINSDQTSACQQLLQLIETLGTTETTITRAVASQDEAALLEAVHHLNGSSRYCGAPELALLVETLETRIRTGGMEDAKPLLNDLYASIRRLCAERARLESGQY
ncbi:ATP-binding protein [Vreelandella aquamarina]